MRRREFIAALGGAAAAWPLTVRAQHAAMPVVGYLDVGLPSNSLLPEFREGLREAGYDEGRNVAIEYRSARDDNTRLAELAADLVRRRVTVIAIIGGTRAALAAKAATTTIPIVFQIGDDPVEAGLVASFNRPGGNITGLTSMSGVLLGKRLGLLHELLPKAARFAVLLVGAPSESMIKDLRKAAASIGAQIEVLNANNDREIDASFASLLQKRPDALLVGPYALFADRHIQIVTLAGRHAIPAIYHNRHFTEAGGLMSYGPKSYDDLTRQVGRYTGRILNGEKPAELPVMQPTRFDLVINLNTARALGLTIPETLLASADKVIE